MAWKVYYYFTTGRLICEQKQTHTAENITSMEPEIMINSLSTLPEG